jgi:hypothetical protein
VRRCAVPGPRGSRVPRDSNFEAFRGGFPQFRRALSRPCVGRSGAARRRFASARRGRYCSGAEPPRTRGYRPFSRAGRGPGDVYR